jgi:secreted trypsin-like serine protease
MGFWRKATYGLAASFVLALFLAAGWGSSEALAQTPEDEGGTYGPYVVGGTAVPNGKYPFVAALLDTRYGSTPYYQQFCGGSLIDRDSVLTAAHCVRGRSASPLRVLVNRTTLSGKGGQTRRVSRIFIHPKYAPSTSNSYDVAVLKLSSPVSGVPAVKLATASQDYLENPGRSATVAGWGNTTAQPPGGSTVATYPDRMREAQVPLVSDTSMRRSYGSHFVPALMVGAGKTGKDTCQGDSGGPMFAKVSGKYTQIGVTSFGAGCGAPGYPGVYAEVNSSQVRTFVVGAARK